MLTQAGPKLMDFGLARSAGRCRFQVSFGNVQIGRSWFAPDGQSVVYLHARTDGQPVLVRRALSAWQSRGGVADTLFSRMPRRRWSRSGSRRTEDESWCP